MKKILLILLCMTFVLMNKALSQELHFDYDEAGNQKVRDWICVNCPIQSTLKPKAGQNKLLDYSGIKDHHLMVYPNPLNEVLNVKWENNDDVFVESIEVFSLSGVRLFFKNHLISQKETTISFLNLAAGSYILKANYSNKKQETIKLIKK